MLYRSLGAKSFAQFWCYWNPIWSYYLAYYVQRPCTKVLSKPVAIFITFSVSGALHDVAISLLKLKPIFFFTPWFAVMGIVVIFTSKFEMTVTSKKWGLRACANITLIITSYLLTDYIITKSFI
nr:MBOAT family O-acyltransferase [Thalassotalea sediminis]